MRPEQLFLDEAEWQQRLHGRAIVQLSPFAAAETAPDSFDAGARPAKNFAAERANSNLNLFDAVRDYLDGERKSGRHAAIAAYTEGSADRLGDIQAVEGLKFDLIICSDLIYYLSDRGKIRARRVSGNCAQHQCDMAVAIKTARELALLPYTQRTVTERGPGRGPRGERGERGEGPPRPADADSVMASEVE